MPATRRLRTVQVRPGASSPSGSARQRHLERLERTYGPELGPLPAGARRHRGFAAYREIAGADALLDPSEPCDRFAQLGTSVAALYTDSIRNSAEPLLSRCGAVIIFGTGQPPMHSVWIGDGDLDSFHSVHVSVHRHLVELSPAEAKHVVLNQLHTGLLDLAGLLDWPTTPFEAAHQHSLERRLTYRWDGPAKHSPDRRHRAIPRFALTDEGTGRAVIEVRDRTGHTVASTESLPAFPTIEGFRRAARTLRWQDATTVSMVSYLRNPSFGDNSKQPTELRLPCS